jgi:hypothetical protein
MTFEMFGAGCFGVVIGFVAWHVFRAGEASLDLKQLAAFIAALLGAVVLSAFPAGTTLFAAYSSGLALGFFLVPVSRMIVFVLTPSPDPSHVHASSEVPDQLKYIEEHWPEVERVVVRSNRIRAAFVNPIYQRFRLMKQDGFQCSKGTRVHTRSAPLSARDFSVGRCGYLSAIRFRANGIDGKIKTAKQIGLTIPQRVLGRADKVIK